MQTESKSTSKQSLSEELDRLWSERDLEAMINATARSLAPGTATDWGLAASADFAIPPISLGGGIPDPQTLPKSGLTEAVRRALSASDDFPLRYGGALGSEPLRSQLSAWYERDHPMSLTADHFMLTNGSAGAIDAVCSALLDRGDVVITESPTFAGSLRTMRGHGADIVTVTVDDQGMDVEALEKTLAGLEASGRRAKMIYTISNFHNPTGSALALARRQQLLLVAARHGAFILDDDAYGEIYFDDERLPTLAALAKGQGVITVGTFSKMVATGLRVGWILADPALIERIGRVRFDMGNSALLHAMLSEYMATGELEQHLTQMRSLYARKAETLQRALVEFAEPYLRFSPPRGGFFLWLGLAKGLTAEGVQRAGTQEGIIFPIGRAFYPDRRDPGEHIRLSYSWTSLDDLREAAVRLGRACERATDEQNRS